MPEIDWSALKIARRLPWTAEWTPTTLEQLSDPDPLVRGAIWQRLEQLVAIQGFLYSAAPFTALALLEQLRQDRVIEKHLAYDLLYEIGNGFDAGHELVTLPDGRTERLEQACRDALESGLDVYIPDLLSPDPILRRNALDLVTSCQQRRPEAEQALQKAQEFGS